MDTFLLARWPDKMSLSGFLLVVWLDLARLNFALRNVLPDRSFAGVGGAAPRNDFINGPPAPVAQTGILIHFT